ncbi:hypothetical protein EniyanLRS_16 [Mycobacterium phage EniyanLRS]|uniref:Uncharacterized protein n=3 Tax=Mycobacterium virus Wildcat TaxID=1993859 RepID=A0A0B5A4T1_9CAUD|nr:hypothetical protein COSMO_19 [Mycobacterium phage Cosmo]AQT25691.1 hypothetical protein EniyanLRS_16 [Mycobacterium phage EniyanLRS]QGJ89909.1 hypothetical protein PBI_MARYV_19 [Mycobacterium phage MaryV]
MSHEQRRREAYYRVKWMRLYRSVGAFYDWQDLKIAEIELLAMDLSRSGMVS